MYILPNSHDYINVDDSKKFKIRSLSDFTDKEYRFKIKADNKNHDKLNQYFLALIKEKTILNVEYYTWEKEHK